MNFARTLGHSIPKNGHSKVWIEIPLVKSSVMLRDEDDEVRREDDPWEAWNNLRTYCEHHPSIGVALVITENLPEDYDSQVIRRWRVNRLWLLRFLLRYLSPTIRDIPPCPWRISDVCWLMNLKAQIVIRGKSTEHPEGLVPKTYDTFTI